MTVGELFDELPLPYDIVDGPRPVWRDYAAQYTTIDKQELIERVRLAMANTAYEPPLTDDFGNELDSEPIIVETKT